MTDFHIIAIMSLLFFVIGFRAGFEAHAYKVFIKGRYDAASRKVQGNNPQVRK